MRQPEWLGNSVSIGLFLMLAAASWGLNQYLQLGRGGQGPVAGTGPNAVIENPKIVRTDARGQAQYRLTAKRIEHDDGRDRSVIDQPIMVSLLSDRPKTTIVADQAVATNHQNQIDLEGNVVIQREAFDGQPPAKITTPRATLLLQEERATTDAPVLVQRGLSTLQGIGMRFDQKTQKIEIVSESRMVMPKEKRE